MKTEKHLKKVRNKIVYREGRTTKLSFKFNDGLLNVLKNSCKRKLQKPSGLPELSERSKVRRAADTMKVCSIIHGGGVSITDGILHTLSPKCSADLLDTKILKMKPAITKVLHEFVLNRECLDFYQSEADIIRALNIYYC